MKTKKSLYAALLCSFFLKTGLVFAQCNTTYGEWEGYNAPYSANEWPITYIRISFDIIQPAAGPGASYLDTANALHKAFIDSILSQMNSDQARNDYITPQNSGAYIADTRIRYVLEGIHAWPNAYLQGDANNLGSGNSLSGDFINATHNPAYATKSSIYRNNTIHILLGQYSSAGATGWDPSIFAPLSGISNSVVVCNNPLGQYNGWITDSRSAWDAYSTVGIALHELGHAFGLQHIGYTPGTPSSSQYNPGYQYDPILGHGCPNLLNAWMQTNNRMDYSPGGTVGHNVTDLQLSNLYGCIFGTNRFFIDNGISTNVRNFIVPVWNNIVPGGTPAMTIANGTVTTWGCPRYLDRDIVIQNGATLTIKCYVAMPPGAKIEVQRGGHLIVDGGTITCEAANSTWHGIDVDGNPSYNQSDLWNGNSFQGWLTLQNGATIKFARAAVWAAEPGANMGGGIVQIRNSYITDCVEGVKFDAYTQPGHDPNQSVIENTVFNVNQVVAGYINSGAAITMWEVFGITIVGNTFENTAPNGAFSGGNRGSGISSIDASYNVRPYDGQPVTWTYSPCNHPSNTVGNNFINLAQGIYIADDNPTLTIENISENQFNDCWNGIYARSSTF